MKSKITEILNKPQNRLLKIGLYLLAVLLLLMVSIYCVLIVPIQFLMNPAESWTEIFTWGGKIYFLNFFIIWPIIAILLCKWLYKRMK